jgi:hypothetical protein
MEPRISLITVGVADVARSRRFYERMGFRAASFGGDDVAFFQAGCMALAVWGRDDLAKDSGAPHAVGAIALAQNVRTKEEVDSVLAAAEAAGASVTKPAPDTFYGGYAGCFADPDGHRWEIAWNPGFPLGPAGELRLPG